MATCVQVLSGDILQLLLLDFFLILICRFLGEAWLYQGYRGYVPAWDKE